MKDFNTEIKEADKIEVISQSAVKKEIKLIGQQLKKPGHTLFEYDKILKVIKVALFKKQDFILSSSRNLTVSHKVDYKENCIYVQALNKKNAIKRLGRDFGIDITEVLAKLNGSVNSH